MNVSYSQAGQDRWVVNLFRGKRNGFFIELGAGNGLHISNTLLLEKEYGWNGILIEPTRAFEELTKNRPNCQLENSCVASERKLVNFFEVYDPGQPGKNLLLSTVRDDVDINDGEIVESDVWGVCKKAYKKEAIPLQEILTKHAAPKIIDYFSLDVEGYEYEVLRKFPFRDYTFLCLGVERPPKELHSMLRTNGYIPVANAYDQMYVHSSIGKYLLLRCIALNFANIARIFLKARVASIVRLISDKV